MLEVDLLSECFKQHSDDLMYWYILSEWCNSCYLILRNCSFIGNSHQTLLADEKQTYKRKLLKQDSGRLDIFPLWFFLLVRRCIIVIIKTNAFLVIFPNIVLEDITICTFVFIVLKMAAAFVWYQKHQN